MNILALDLGTHTGYAHNFDETLVCGTFHLISDGERRLQKDARMDRRCDCRIKRLFDELQRFKGKTDVVVFEDVEFALYRLQVQLWSSLRAAVWLAFPFSTIECVSTGALKKFATGHGGADKTQMARALGATDTRFTLETRGSGKKKKECVFFNPSPTLGDNPLPALDDNAVDAVWIHKWAQRNLSRTRL